MQKRVLLTVILATFTWISASAQFEDLSKKDFEMSLANAKALDDKYFRTLAVIAVATNCAKNAKPVAKPKAKP